MKKLIIPERFSGVDYQRDVPDELKKIVDSFPETRRGLFIYGKAGTGKTHLAYAICKHLQNDENMGTRAFKSYEILRYIRDDISRQTNGFETRGEMFFGEGTETFYDGIQNFNGMLFIDDIGVEKDSEWSLQILYEIIDKKYENMIPMIITSNLTLEEIGTKFGDRFASRIAGLCEVYEKVGEDKRLLLDEELKKFKI